MFFVGGLGDGGRPNTLKVNEPRRPLQPPLPISGWHRGLEMLTHGAESSPRNPRNPPEKSPDGRVRWSLGMCSEESVTYLLAELSEPQRHDHFHHGQPVSPLPPFFLFVWFLNQPSCSSFVCALPSVFSKDTLLLGFSLAGIAVHNLSDLIQPPPDPCPPCCSPSEVIGSQLE